MMPTILVVEDEPDLNQMICDFLKHTGYATIQAYDGSSALRLLFQTPPDLVILDLNLPQVDGLDVARTITTQTNVPVILATARGEEEDRLHGFQAGADDYVVKPFSLPELAMRVAAVLRRSQTAEQAPNTGVVTVDDLVIDPEQYTVHVAGRPVHLTAVQFALLLHLSRNPGRVYSRLQLLESVQQDSFEGYERTIDVHIKNIRKLIEAEPANPRRIVTVWGVGYRMERHA
ncbi:MAG TPA: response regulator transcription factor [Alkalispirochaeta sp.]|nr:response regulator transcription factor [Alkalispirochaeta sp.]